MSGTELSPETSLVSDPGLPTSTIVGEKNSILWYSVYGILSWQLTNHTILGLLELVPRTRTEGLKRKVNQPCTQIIEPRY